MKLHKIWRFLHKTIFNVINNVEMEKMIKRLIGLALLFTIILMACSGKLGNIAAFFTWLLMLDYSGPSTSIFGEIVVRVITISVSFCIVGVVFDFLGFYSRQGMKLVYFIVSSLLSFFLTWVIWFFEKYRAIIGISFGVVLFLLIGLIVLIKIIKKRKGCK